MQLEYLLLHTIKPGPDTSWHQLPTAYLLCTYTIDFPGELWPIYLYRVWKIDSRADYEVHTY